MKQLSALDCSVALLSLFLLHQGKKGVGDAPGDVEQKKFDGTGYDSDLVDSLERDIVSRNPNIHWYESIHGLLLLLYMFCYKGCFFHHTAD